MEDPTYRALFPGHTVAGYGGPAGATFGGITPEKFGKRKCILMRTNLEKKTGTIDKNDPWKKLTPWKLEKAVYSEQQV